MWTSPSQTRLPTVAVMLATCAALGACSPLFEAESGLATESSDPSTARATDASLQSSDTALVAEQAEEIAALTPQLQVLRPYLRGNAQFGWQPGQLGRPEEFWNRRVNNLPVHPDSSAVTGYLAHVSRKDKSDPSTEFFGQFDLGKKANGENYSFHILEADADTPRYDFTRRLRGNGFSADEFYSPHCDRIAMPVPANGRLQGEPDYRCSGGGDCHLYVVSSHEGRIYEQYRADNPGPNKRKYAGGCTNVWDLTTPQPENLRGLSCTSSNAAGIPYIPLLFTPGEIKAGVIRHALAFTLPNAWVERDTYARPATHNPIVRVRWGAPQKAPGKAMRYGSHLRLNADFQIAPQWPQSLKVVLQALKDYGMYHIDGGPRFIVASNDTFSAHHWDDPDIALNPFDLTKIANLSWTNFEVISKEGAIGSMNRNSCRRRMQREKPPRKPDSAAS